MRSLGADWQVGPNRLATVASKRASVGVQRSCRLRGLRGAGASIGHVYRSGPQASALGGCAVRGPPWSYLRRP
eukprot:3051954-Pyramimonas_sp.AAC.1